MHRHIVAIDENRGIAKDGVQPWKLPLDEQFFTESTKLDGGMVLMGRTTYEVMGGPLTGRDNYVLTNNRSFKANGVQAIYDVEAFLNENPNVWIIGGAQVYAVTLPYMDELYVTEIRAGYDCDVFYPEIPSMFKEKSRSILQFDNDTSYQYVTYVKI